VTGCPVSGRVSPASTAGLLLEGSKGRGHGG
jgi:hypothetical protein